MRRLCNCVLSQSKDAASQPRKPRLFVFQISAAKVMYWGKIVIGGAKVMASCLDYSMLTQLSYDFLFFFFVAGGASR
jgi:hypothetical protein